MCLQTHAHKQCFKFCCCFFFFVFLDFIWFYGRTQEGESKYEVRFVKERLICLHKFCMHKIVQTKYIAYTYVYTYHIILPLENRVWKIFLYTLFLSLLMSTTFRSLCQKLFFFLACLHITIFDFIDKEIKECMV